MPFHEVPWCQVWKIVGAMANRWLDVIESRGSTMTNDEVWCVCFWQLHGVWLGPELMSMCDSFIPVCVLVLQLDES